MHEPLPLTLFANGFIPGRGIAVPEGREALYYWAAPVFLSLGVLVFGLWVARVRNVRTGPARAPLWAGAGFLAVSYSAWGIGAHQETGVFHPGWASWFAFPILLALAVGWWTVWLRLARPGPLRPRLEVLSWCLTVGYFSWWLACLTNDLNWMHWNWSKSLALTMPWLWAGAFGLVVWGGCWRDRSAASLQIRGACIVGAVGGLVVMWLGSLIAGGVLVALWQAGTVSERVLDVRRGFMNRDLQLFVSMVALGAFAFGGAALSTWLRRGAWRVAENDPVPHQDELPSASAASPASTSSG